VATVRPEGIPGDVIKGGSSGPLIANVGRRVGVMYATGGSSTNRPAFRTDFVTGKNDPEVHYYFPAHSY